MAIVDDNVLKFQVAMNDCVLVFVRRVQVSQAIAQLLQKEPRLLHRKSFCALVAHVLVKRYPTDVFLHQVNLFCSLKVIVEFAYMRVLKFLHAHDLSKDSSPLTWVIEFMLWVNFDSYPLLRLLVLCKFDLCVGS
jgi:hypothetical protein